MTTFSNSYGLRVLLATSKRCLDAAAGRWLSASPFDDCRLERHYMRGPGQKWRQKHACGAAH
jgi:hypothetical protein